jgi:hypothetical protein
MTASIMSHWTTAAQAADFTAEPAATQAVWMPQEISFYYHSFTTFYTCSSLTDKVKRLLLELGAKRDISVRSTGCLSGNGIARMPTVRIRLSSPVEATPAALAELEKTRTMRELIARVRGESAAAKEAAAAFPAHWRRVAVTRGKFSLDAGDCELVNELKRKVLPKLSIRIAIDDMSCSSHQLGRGYMRLEMEALTAGAEVPDAAQRRIRRKENEAS